MRSKMFLVIVFACLLPLSMFLWGAATLSSWFSNDSIAAPTPARWLCTLVTPCLIVAWGYRKRSLDLSGVVSGFVVGAILTLSSYCFMSSMLAFFITSSLATKFKSNAKRLIEVDFKEGGQRNFIQVICNGAAASCLALFYMAESGVGEHPIDLHRNYHGSIFALGVLCALAEANGDTWASEFGSVWGGKKPRLITSGELVPPGTNGGVSLSGLMFSALGGAVVGVAYYVTLWLCVTSSAYSMAHAQWPLIVVGTLAGFFGSLLDSVLGALLQYSGIDERTGKVVEEPGPHVRHICGTTILTNHSVNLITSFLTGFIMPAIFVVPLWRFLET